MTLLKTPEPVSPDVRCSTRTCKKRRTCKRYRCPPRGGPESICLDFGDDCNSYLRVITHRVDLIDARDDEVDRGVVR